MPYAAPLADMRFALEAGADLWSVRRDRNYTDLDPDLLAAILDGAGALASATLAPLNRIGDQEGVTLKDGVVTTAPGFKDAYKQFIDGGWQGLVAPTEFGGSGLPSAVALCAYEMFHGANMSFTLAPMLTLAAIEAINTHGAPDQKALYLAKLVSGEWAGAMVLTEPQAGSDLGAINTKAVPSLDGSYRLSGQKIFITWGEHDLTANIIYLVLARIEAAPGGSKGLSLFIVPKFRDADGSRNAVRCVGLEEKLGIHASPTCVMAFESATAWLIGEENKGLAAMFTMMNAARLNVGVEGVGVAEAAYQRALAFAKERKQGGAMIVQHPDVRRMLMDMRAKIQVGRMLCYAAAVAADKADHKRVDLLTPLAKAWCTDRAVEVASLGVQTHGGMGYIEETGAAQFYRDARITPIYEGTNGIQAIDLVGRKVQGDGGQAMRALIAEAHEAAATMRHPASTHLAAAADALDDATTYVLEQKNRADALAGACAYLDLAAETAGGTLFAQGLLRAPALAASPKPILVEQSAVLGYFAATTLARAPSRLAAIKLGAAALDDPALLDLA